MKYYAKSLFTSRGVVITSSNAKSAQSLAKYEFTREFLGVPFSFYRFSSFPINGMVITKHIIE